MAEQVVPLGSKPALRKAHVHILNSYDCATLLDCSAYPGLTLGAFLTLPLDWIIAHWNIT